MGTKITLQSSQIHSLISENKFKIKEDKQFLGHCIDGRYANGIDFPPLAIPGSDIGDLAVLYATGEKYGFEVDYEKALTTLQELVGKNNLNWHTDCGHLKQLRIDPAAYDLNKKDIEMLDKQMEKAKKAGAQEVKVEGEHIEGAILLIRGAYSVLPRYTLHTDQGNLSIAVFAFHQTLVDARHRAWAVKLLETKAVGLFDDLDEEYLYEVMSETTEAHFFETTKRLAKDLPIYLTVFNENGSFEIEQEGFV